MKIYDYPKEGTIPLGVHMMQTTMFMKMIVDKTQEMLPTLIKVHQIRREMALRKLSDPKPTNPEFPIDNEGDEFSFTEQSI